jgi:two-component system, OmpR family, phosphate regulon sensor histidine kinase PhoR
MNKKIITGLILIMGISIVGIIIIQLVWMNNAIKVKNELFDRNVNEALTNATNRLETLQDFKLINHFAFEEGNPEMLLPPPPPPPPNLGISGQKKNHSGPESPHDREIKMIVHAGKSKNGFSYRIETRNDSLRNIEEEIIVETDSLEQKLGKVYITGINKFDSITERLSLISDSANGLKNRIERKTVRLKQVANQVVQEISTWEEEVHIERVNEALKKELENRNIIIPFQLAILKDSVITDHTDLADTLQLKQSNYMVKLFPNGIFENKTMISVYFPDKDSFIYQTLNWLLLISLVFSIIVLLSFAFSIYFLLKQKKISEMKTDFINNMTHEFKTPLATISVASDSIINLKVIEDPARIKYFVDMIKKENTRMNRQVEDILTIARLESKDFEFKWEAFDLHEVIEEAIQSIELQVEKKGGKITRELTAENPVATSDPSHFANVVYNLLDNANKYSINAPEIKISTRNKGDGLIVSVEDQGPGMTKAVQSRIFERFYRQTSGNIHNVKGFGLGLSYVKAVLEANQGYINVHSEPGKGSRFDLFIPFIRN